MGKKRALVTGITGFVGSHLAEYLLKENYEVWGINRHRSPLNLIEHIKNDIKVVDADLSDAHSIDGLLPKANPDYIFHLAAQSFVPTSWVSPASTLQVNIIGTVNLFEAVREAKINPPIQVACSSEEYGLVQKDELPIKEDNPLRPLSPYAVSKIGQDYLSYQYSKSYGMKIVRTRAFNHTGPRRGDVFSESNFAKQIAEIEKGKREPIVKVGNLDAYRDYTDVRDIVKAYIWAVQKCEAGEVYNIASGQTWQIKKVLEILISMSTLKDKIKIQKDPARMRPSDVAILRGDATKFRKKTGWKPEIPFEKTMEDLLNYWREVA